MAMPQLKEVAQLGMDERHIDDPTVEQALEERQTAKDELAQYRLAYKNKDKAAKAAAAQLEMPDPDTEEVKTAVRVGRFRITKRFVKGRSVSFETESRVQLTIGLADEPDADEETEPGYEDASAEQAALERLDAEQKYQPVAVPDPEEDGA